VENEPLNLTKSYIPYKYVEGIENHNFCTESLYKVLREEYQIELVKSIRTVEAILANEELAEDLEIPENAAILKFDGQVTAKLPSKEVVILEYFRTYYRTDKVKFYVAQTSDI
jgi:GntR family transcriptional regulator